MTYDLILRGGRVIDPSQRLDAVTDVAFSGGKVAKVAPKLQGGAGTDVRDVSGSIVTPGLIDLHTHVYWGGTSLGIDAEEFCRTSRRHDLGRHRQRRARQLRRLPQARDRALPGAHPGLPARVARRHLRLLRPRHGGRERRSAADEPDRCRRGRQRQPRRDRRHQGARRPACVGHLRRRAAAHRAGGGRRRGHAADGAHRSSPAELRGGDRHAAPGRHPHARLPPVPQLAGHARRAPSSARCWRPASAA